MIVPTKRDEAWRYSDLAAVASLGALPAAEHIVVPAHGSLTRHLIQAADADAVAVHDFTISVGTGGRCIFHILNIGGKLGRVSLTVTLHHSAYFELGGIQLGSGNQTLEIVANIMHVEPNATSKQTVRTVLTGKATGNYLGKIYVGKAAQKTDASQSSKALLLTRTATANTKPELEIHADDVKCAHGATVGELDANALFYLQSRGLDAGQAKALLTRAFIGAMIDSIADDAMQAEITQRADEWLQAVMQ